MLSRHRSKSGFDAYRGLFFGDAFGGAFVEGHASRAGHAQLAVSLGVADVTVRVTPLESTSQVDLSGAFVQGCQYEGLALGKNLMFKNTTV